MCHSPTASIQDGHLLSTYGIHFFPHRDLLVHGVTEKSSRAHNQNDFLLHLIYLVDKVSNFSWSDLEIPAPGSEDQLCDTPSEVVSGPRLTLTLRGPNLPGIPDVDVPITKKSSTIFTAVQTLVHAANFPSRQERLRRIWEPTYT